jgi:hypothetical protein
MVYLSDYRNWHTGRIRIANATTKKWFRRKPLTKEKD